MIVQKYIERPLTLKGKKFDIRLWVLVTSVNPLVVWYYSDYYLRFSSREYSGDDFARGKQVDRPVRRTLTPQARRARCQATAPCAVPKGRTGRWCSPLRSI